jgi:hypothetical protein
MPLAENRRSNRWLMVAAGHWHDLSEPGNPSVCLSAVERSAVVFQPELRSRVCQHEPTQPTSIWPFRARSVTAVRSALRCASSATSHGSPRRLANKPCTRSCREAVPRPSSNAQSVLQRPSVSYFLWLILVLLIRGRCVCRLRTLRNFGPLFCIWGSVSGWGRAPEAVWSAAPAPTRSCACPLG